MLKKPEKCIKTPIENCNPITEVALMCITYSWYVDGVMYPEIFQISEDTLGLCANEKWMFFNFLAHFSTKKVNTYLLTYMKFRKKRGFVLFTNFGNVLPDLKHMYVSKGKFLSERTNVFVTTPDRQTFFFPETENLNFADF